jgi:hypothetical protein
MKKLLITGLLLFPFLLLAQEQAPYKYADRNVEPSETRLTNSSDSPSVIARISLIVPMFVLEFAPVEHFVFSSSVRIWPTFWEKNDQGVTIYNPDLNPLITLEPRYFFTQSYRRQKGRRTDYFSGWYLGFPFAMSIPELDFSMGTVLGFQCTFGKRWYWNVGMGPGVTYQDTRFKMSLSSTVAFGVILN